MARNDSRAPRSGGPKRDSYKSGGPRKKPWERRERSEGEERGEGGGYRKPFGQRPAFDRPGRGFGGGERDTRGPRRPFDDELFAASGKVAEIVGTEPQSRYDMLRKLWDFFREERLVSPAGRRVRANADSWRGEGDERPPRDRKPFAERTEGERPYRPRPPEGREDRPYRKRAAEGGEERGERAPFPRRPSSTRPPYKSTRKPAGNHPTARKAQSLEGVPRRKFKDTREREE